MADSVPDRLKVLVVEDDEVNAVVLVSVIERLGHEARWVDSGRKTLDTLRDHACDVVLLDLLMPGMNGFEVVAAIRNETDLSGLPVYALSALDDEETRLSCNQAGMDGFITKPVDAGDLERVLSGLAPGR